MSAESELEALLAQVDDVFREYELEQVGDDRPRVVFIPGIMGSGLIDTSVAWYAPWPEAIWGTRRSLAWSANEAGWRARLLKGNGLDKPGDVVKGDLLDLSPMGPDPYSGFVARLRRYTDLLVFTYDWRLSNEIHAQNLAAEIVKRWFPRDRPESIPPERRVVIIAHSMGGLIARAFIEALKGYRYVQRLITVATPHLGAPDAFANYYGWTNKLPKLLMKPALQQELTRSYASALQLLPIYPFVTYRGNRESADATYARRRMLHALTRLDVNAVRRRLWKGLMQPRQLNAWLCGLGARRMQYYTLASTGLTTVAGYNEDKGKLEYTTVGDGTVLLVSAWLPDGPRGRPAPSVSCIGRQKFEGIEHMRVFENPAIQDRCLELIPVTLRTAEMEVTELERELERVH